MRTLDIHEAKTRLSAVLVDIEQGGEGFIICRNGTPVADLVPHVTPERSRPHPVMSKISIDYDATEPLSEDEWESKE